MKSEEYRKFDLAMTAILGADPRAVKNAMEAESRVNAEERAARGEHKRGRKKAAKKRPSVFSPASSARDD